MTGDHLKKLPGQTLSIFFLCTAIVLVSYFVVLYPNTKLLSRLDGEINSLRDQIEEQKMLSPNYDKFLKMTQEDMSGSLPSPPKSKLPQNKIETLPILFREIARENDLDPVSITMNIKSLANKPGFLVLNTLIRGDLLNFRNFLIKLQEVPYIEHMEKIRIQGALLSKILRLKLWIAISR